MHRRLQFGMRENPASDRRHGSCQALDSSSRRDCRSEERGTSSPLIPSLDHLPTEATSKLHPAVLRASTAGKNIDQHRLLTIHELADLLQVPASWVYAHTRERCANRIPGIRLGKYWRFDKADVEAWIDANRRKDYMHVG